MRIILFILIIFIVLPLFAQKKEVIKSEKNVYNHQYKMTTNHQERNVQVSLEIVNTYFTLSDLAGKDSAKLLQLCELFDNNATIEPNTGNIVKGENAIRSFFEVFFGKNNQMKHIWTIKNATEKYIEVEWGVVCQRKTGEIFTLTGTDFFVIENHKIINLKVVGNKT